MTKMNGVPFRKNLVPSSKYSIKCPYSMNPKKVTLHNTDNEVSADNEIRYMISNNNQTSYHLAIDEKEAIQGLPYDRNGWHSGDGGNGYGNRNTIGVEICRNYDRARKTTDLNEPLKSQYSKAEQNTIKVVAQLCIDEDIVANNSNIKTHNDWNGKWCPRKILNEKRLQQVKSDIIAEYNRLKGLPAPSKPSELSSGKADGHLSKSQVIDKTISGGYGNSDTRRTNINTKTNFTYDEIQKEVNAKLLGSKPAPSKPKPKWTTETVAQQIAKGEGGWGNGDTRVKNVKNAGLNPTTVQNRVNAILGAKSKPKSTSSGVKVGSTVTARRLYSTSSSTRNVRTTSIRGYVDKVNKGWRNEVRLRNKKGGYYIGFTRLEDIQ